MGWKIKALAFIVALALLGYGGWIFAIPLFLYTFSGLIFRGWRKPIGGSATQGSQIGWKRSGSRVWMKAIGVLFVVLALVAVGARGTFSPFIFGFIGLTVLLWRPLSRSSLFGTFKPVADSILLRGTANPFAWVALAEVKLLTHDVGKALLGISERIVVIASERPSIYVAVRAAALSRKGAERKILERFAVANNTVAPLGAYLLPLDGEKVMGILGASMEGVELNRDDLASFLSSTPYDLLSLETEYGLLKSVGVYRKVGAKKRGSVSIPPSRNIPLRLPLLAEVFRSVGARVQWPNPDQFTAFLTSMFATRFLPDRQRITESARSAESKTTLVKSLGTPVVELSRAELRAVSAIYDR